MIFFKTSPCVLHTRWSYVFGMIWGSINGDRIFMFGTTYPPKSFVCWNLKSSTDSPASPCLRIWRGSCCLDSSCAASSARPGTSPDSHLYFCVPSGISSELPARWNNTALIAINPNNIQMDKTGNLMFLFQTFWSGIYSRKTSSG